MSQNKTTQVYNGPRVIKFITAIQSVCQYSLSKKIFDQKQDKYTLDPERHFLMKTLNKRL